MNLYLSSYVYMWKLFGTQVVPEGLFIIHQFSEVPEGLFITSILVNINTFLYLISLQFLNN